MHSITYWMRHAAAVVAASAITSISSAQVGLMPGSFIRLDDAMTIIQPLKPTITWEADLNPRSDSTLGIADMTVHLKLDVASFRGQRVRLYQMMEAGKMPWTMTWQSRGGMSASGSGRPGQRVVIFDGTLPQGARYFEDQLSAQVVVDSNHADRARSFSLSYGLEVVR